jgi:MHS family alpha-ketoglutarate permease-like MFS transporter
MLLAFSLSYAIFVIPLFGVLGTSAWSVLIVMVIGLIMFSFYAAVAPTAMAELFPTQVRTVGIGFPYSITVAIFGGTAPYIVEYLTQHGHRTWFPWYVAALSMFSAIVYLFSRETKGINLDQV